MTPPPLSGHLPLQGEAGRGSFPCIHTNLVVSSEGWLIRIGYADRPVFLGPGGRLQGDCHCPAGAVDEVARRIAASLLQKARALCSAACPAGSPQSAVRTFFTVYWRPLISGLRHRRLADLPEC